MVMTMTGYKEGFLAAKNASHIAETLSLDRACHVMNRVLADNFRKSLFYSEACGEVFKFERVDFVVCVSCNHYAQEKHNYKTREIWLNNDLWNRYNDIDIHVCSTGKTGNSNPDKFQRYLVASLNYNGIEARIVA